MSLVSTIFGIADCDVEPALCAIDTATRAQRLIESRMRWLASSRCPHRLEVSKIVVGIVKKAFGGTGPDPVPPEMLAVLDRIRD